MRLSRITSIVVVVVVFALGLSSCTGKRESDSTQPVQQEIGTESGVEIQETSAQEEPIQRPTSDTDAISSKEETAPVEDTGRVEVVQLDLSKSSVSTGEGLDVNILLENTSTNDRSRSFGVELDGVAFAEFTVSLIGLSRTTHSLTLLTEQPGEHVVGVGGESATFSVLPESSESTASSITGDGVSVRLIRIDRHDEAATLWFWIEKHGTDWPNDLVYEVEVSDDHGNLYARTLRLDIGGSLDDATDLLPSGFGYADTIDVAIPSIAPIEHILLDSEPIEDLPSGLDVLGPLPGVVEETAAIGDEVALGEWATYTLGAIEPGGSEWNLPLTIRNLDYVALEAEIDLGLQHEDGTISWTQRRVEVEGSSETTSRVTLPTEMWIDDSPAKPRCVILCLRNAASQESVVTVYPLRDTDLPPLVGQGATQVAEAFQRAYENGGGADSLGAPSHLPTWFRGGTSPFDENDILVQLFPDAPRWGGAALVLDKLDGAYSAILLPASYWEKYKDLGGPYFTSQNGIALGAPLRVKATTIPFASILFEGGSLQDTCALREQTSLQDCICYLPPPFASLDFEIANESQLEVSPDSRFIVILEHNSGNANAYIVPIDDLDNSELLGEDMSRFRGIAFSPDAQLLAATHPDDNSISLWDIESRTLIRRIEGHRRSIGSEIAFSPDGSKLVTWCPDDIRIWNVQTGQLLHSFDDDNAWRSAHFFTLDGTAVFVVDKDRIELIDASSGRIIRSFEGHDDRIWELDLSQDGQVLASGSSDGSVILWDVQSGRIITRLQANPDSLCFNPEGAILACSSGGWVRLWDTQRGQQLLALYASDHWQGVEVVQISPDGKTLITASWDDKVRLWDLSELMKGVHISDNEEETSTQGDAIPFDIPEALRLKMAGTGEAVAVVRGIPIAREQLNARVAAVVSARENSDYPADYNSSWKEVMAGSERAYYVQQIREEELSQLVAKALVSSELEARGEPLDSNKVETELVRMLSDHLATQGITEEQWVDSLEAFGNTRAQAFEDARYSAWYALAQPLIVGQGSFTDDELREFFERNRSDYSSEEQIHASHIMLGSEQEAMEVLQLLESGAEFEETAVSRSLDSGVAHNRGDLGWFTRGRMVAEFENAAFALSDGELSGVVRTSYGYHIILVHENLSASRPSYEDVQEQVREDLAADWVGREFETWLRDAMETDVVVYR